MLSNKNTVPLIQRHVGVGVGVGVGCGTMCEWAGDLFAVKRTNDAIALERILRYSAGYLTATCGRANVCAMCCVRERTSRNGVTTEGEMTGWRQPQQPRRDVSLCEKMAAWGGIVYKLASVNAWVV